MITKCPAIYVGLDGATFDQIDPLVASGRLPTFARLLASGVRGRLISTIPPATIPAWPTFMTGKSPGQHGVFDFFKRENGGERRLVSARDIHGPTLWRYLSDQGYTCVVLNVPCTYPPQPIRGILVSGMLTPPNDEYVHPPEMKARLDAWTGGYRVNPRSEFIRSPFDRQELLRELREVSLIQKQAFLKLLDEEPWDLAMLMFRATDIVQHKLWHRPEDIAAIYELVDEVLAEIVAAAGDASIWLMSDHGFGPLKKHFHINHWLREQGWLDIRPKTGEATQQTDRRSQESHSGGVASLQRWLARTGISRDRARTLLPDPVQALLKRFLPRRVRRWMPGTSYEADWSRTQVFSDNLLTQETQALRINLRGREPQGIVESGNFESICDLIIQALKDVQDPETGAQVVEHVHKGSDLFAGPFVDAAPDLILELADGYKMMGGFVAREVITCVSPVSGCHRRDGIFVATGPDIAPGLDLGQLSIADLMPTMLHWLGLAVPSECDGQVRRDLFVPGSEPAGRPATFADLAPDTLQQEAESEEDDREILARLEALGYIS